ncbi:MAG: T9SS type A sorting domain-containing protein [Bacteroidales bacterium]|nr:T9SS type A sorting domain-containing protein [Bacteroidales bacterium]MDD4603695.1 T9SS type A sorting domain-containing protein [Bacteroidales bacterium]
MKKLLLLFSALFSAGFLFAQTDCSDIFISEYVEGWYNNKALEIYNPTKNAIKLDSLYRLVRWDNGKTTSADDPMYVLPLTGTIESYKVMVIIQDTTKPGQDTMVWPELRKKATFLAPYDYDGTTPGGRCVFWNGDDAISIQKKQNNGTWKDIDIFGEIGVRPLDWQGGTTGAWTDTKPYWRGTGVYLTKDQSLIRKKNIYFGIDKIRMSHYGDSITGIYPNSFYAFAEYDTMPANFFDSLGHHICNCETWMSVNNIKGINSITVQPNPVTNNQFTVISFVPIASVEVVSIVGRSLFVREFSSHQKEVKIQLSDLPHGIYLVKIITGDNQSVIKKVIIQ